MVVIVFRAQPDPRVLQKVSLRAGGVPVAATTLGSGETLHRRPYFLPDGEHFLYFTSWRSCTGNHMSPRSPLPSRSYYCEMPPKMPCTHRGICSFWRETTLMAQSFDPRRLDDSLARRFRSRNQMVSTNTPPIGVFSASENGVIAYASRQATAGTELVWFDRAGKEIDVLGTPAAYGDLELYHQTESGHLFPSRTEPVMHATSGFTNVIRRVRTRFTSDPGTDQSPIWSPDGSQRRVQFESEGAAGSELVSGKGV